MKTSEPNDLDRSRFQFAHYIQFNTVVEAFKIPTRTPNCHFVMLGLLYFLSSVLLDSDDFAAVSASCTNASNSESSFEANASSLPL